MTKSIKQEKKAKGVKMWQFFILMPYVCAAAHMLYILTS